jgi:hypothetical protein
MCQSFYVSYLKPCKVDTLWPDHKQIVRPHFSLVGDNLEYEVRGNPQV